MPKMKTKKSVSKRFRLTKKGRVKRSKAFLGHICTKKSSKRKRSLRSGGLVSVTEHRKIKKQLPYG